MTGKYQDLYKHSLQLLLGESLETHIARLECDEDHRCGRTPAKLKVLQGFKGRPRFQCTHNQGEPGHKYVNV